MSKKYSKKFWLLFWLASAVFLFGWYVFWNTKHRGISSTIGNFFDFMPISEMQKNDYKSLGKIAEYFLNDSNDGRTFLVLLQNNLEIRPSGGFIGAIAVLKTRGGKIVSLKTYDLSTFDANVRSNEESPYPIGDIMGTKMLKLRDSNFSPDFETDARKAIELYNSSGNYEKFDGVFAITANTLSSLLKVTGPIQLEGYPGTYDSQNAVISLEYQVEKAFVEQGIDRGQRKNVLSDLAKEIEQRLLRLTIHQKIDLVKIIIEDLDQKDIQLYFADENMQEITESSGWSGNVDSAWGKDYLMAVDANIGAFKSDYYVRRSLDYSVDLSGDKPTANLRIIYKHTANQADWMTRNYLTYLRVYVPDGSWLYETSNFNDPRFGIEFGKKYFASIVKVPIGEERTVELKYTLPENLKDGNYDLLVQKQAGLTDVSMHVRVKMPDGEIKDFSKMFDRDLILRDVLK